MTERLHIGTHKGLFELARHNGVWDIAVALRGHDDAFIGFVSQKIADGWGFQQDAAGRVQKLLGIIEVAGILDPCIWRVGHPSCLPFFNRPRLDFSYNRTESDAPRTSIVRHC